MNAASRSAAYEGAIRTAYGRDCRLRDAKQAVKDRYYAERMRRNADMQAELDDLERQFWAGEAM